MATNKSASLGVKDLGKLQSALKKVDADTTPALKEGFKGIAEDVASAIRPKVPRLRGRAAGSVKARGSSRGGSIAFGGQAAPHFPWLDFGGSVGRNRSIKRDFIPEGRYVFPTIREKRPDIERQVDDVLERVIKNADFDTRED